MQVEFPALIFQEKMNLRFFRTASSFSESLKHETSAQNSQEQIM